MDSNLDTPLVSLLVATKDEELFIEECLKSILRQDYPGDSLEVFILDGMSTDNTLKIVNRLIENKLGFSLIENKRVIQSAGWNLGLDLCHGEIISIVSGHVIMDYDYVSKAINTLQRTCADLVGGTVKSINHDAMGKTIALAMSSPFGVGGARFRYTDIEEETDTVFMGFCRREVYEKIGKYDEELVRNQDDEFSYRLRKAGGKIICNPEIKSSYFTRSNLRSLWKQYFQYGFWKVRVLQKHPAQMCLRHFVPPMFILSLIVAILLTLIFPWGWVIFSCLLGSYLLANLSVSLFTARKHGNQNCWSLPLAFATLHVSYGTGFLMGLIRFWDRWNDRLGDVPQMGLKNAG